MVLIFIVVLLAVFFAVNVKVVPQSEKWVIERLGVYHDSWDAGLHFLCPFIDRVANKATSKEVVLDFAPQNVITKDNVTMMIDTVVYLQITNSELFTYGVDDPISAVENLTATTLRSIIGDKDLDETLTSREDINDKMCRVLDVATDPWGIKVNRVEVKNIIPPRDIQEAMEKQMRAEREKREAILKAEGEKQSSILSAQGMKESAILKAEADRQTAIMKAEAEAEAIRIVAEAEANSIETISKSNPSREYITLEALKTYKSLADGNATKIVVPQNLQDIATSYVAANELLLK